MYNTAPFIEEEYDTLKDTVLNEMTKAVADFDDALLLTSIYFLVPFQFILREFTHSVLYRNKPAWQFVYVIDLALFCSIVAAYLTELSMKVKDPTNSFYQFFIADADDKPVTSS